MLSATNSQSSSAVSSSSANSSDISDIQNAIRRKQTEYLQAVQELSSPVEDYPEYESVHERVESLIDHKVRAVMGMIQQLKLANVEVPDNMIGDLQKVLDMTVKSLSQELRDIKKCLKKNQDEILKAEKELASMVKQMEVLKIAAKKREETKEMHTLEDLQKKLRSASREFQKYKKILHETIDEIFPDKKQLVHELLGDLCDQSFQSQDGDKYITIDDNIDYYPVLELFLDADIVRRHPHDMTRIKLSDI